MIKNKFIKENKNVFLGIISFLIAFLVFKLAGITLNAGQWFIILLLILIYFEIMEIKGK